MSKVLEPRQLGEQAEDILADLEVGLPKPVEEGPEPAPRPEQVIERPGFVSAGGNHFRGWPGRRLPKAVAGPTAGIQGQRRGNHQKNHSIDATDQNSG